MGDGFVSAAQRRRLADAADGPRFSAVEGAADPGERRGGAAPPPGAPALQRGGARAGARPAAVPLVTRPPPAFITDARASFLAEKSATDAAQSVNGAGTASMGTSAPVGDDGRRYKIEVAHLHKNGGTRAKARCVTERGSGCHAGYFAEVSAAGALSAWEPRADAHGVARACSCDPSKLADMTSEAAAAATNTGGAAKNLAVARDAWAATVAGLDPADRRALTAAASDARAAKVAGLNPAGRRALTAAVSDALVRKVTGGRVASWDRLEELTLDERRALTAAANDANVVLRDEILADFAERLLPLGGSSRPSRTCGTPAARAAPPRRPSTLAR